MVEGAALEMRCARKGIGGSNPPVSAKIKNRQWRFLIFGRIQLGRGRETGVSRVGRQEVAKGDRRRKTEGFRVS